MKDDYSYWSENLHSAYLFYTLEVDKLNRENQRLREALNKVLKLDAQENDFVTLYYDALDIAKQALGE